MNKTNTEYNVVKSNILINAKYKLSLIEQKIILYLMSKIKPTDTKLIKYTLKISDLFNILSIGKANYTFINNILKNLSRKTFELEDTNACSWLETIRFPKRGYLEIGLSLHLEQYLLKLNKCFTSFKLSNILKMKSSYSIRIYELLKQHENIRFRMFSLEDIKERLVLDDKYMLYSNLKNRIIIPSIQEINKYTDIRINMKEIKEGNKVVGIEYRIETAKYKEEKIEIKILDLIDERLVILATDENGFQINDYDRVARHIYKK